MGSIDQLECLDDVDLAACHCDCDPTSTSLSLPDSSRRRAVAVAVVEEFEVLTGGATEGVSVD